MHEPGGLAAHITWPADRVVPLRGVDPGPAAILADAVATAYRALAKARLPTGGRLCVIGSGGVGTQAARLASVLDSTCEVLCVVRSAASARRLEREGISAVIDEDSDQLAKQERFDAVVDFSGSAGAPALGVKLLTFGGTYVLGSVLEGDLALGAAQRIQARELTVVGVFASTMSDLRQVVSLVEADRLDLAGSVTHEFALSDAELAFRTLRERPAGMVRVIVRPDQG